MKAVHHPFSRSAAVAAVSALLTVASSPAYAAPAGAVDINTVIRDLNARLQRVDRDLRDVQAEIYRRPPGSFGGGQPPPPPPAASGPQELGPVLRRLDELSDSITKLNGQMEELNHQVDMLAQKTDRMQKDMDFQAKQAAQAPSDSVASLAPGGGSESGVLGRIPADADLPSPPPQRASGPKAEYDSAMNLLSRGQTNPARERFRAFVDNYPDDERASAAQYWTANIAYSTQKDYEQAARDFAELLKRYPMSQNAPEGMLKLGLSLIQLGQVREGCAALVALPAKYPAATPSVATRARNARRDNKCR